MNKIVCRLLWMLCLICFMASCSSTKSLEKSVSIDGMSETEYVEHIIYNAGGREGLTAKMSLSIEADGKNATKVNGTLRMKKGEVIQLSIAPLLGIEVARAEISPDGILVIDRMNKRYVQLSFTELKSLVNADLDFHSLQALFLNELFLPGKSDLTHRDISDFEVEPGADGVVLKVKKARRFDYRFLTQAPEGLLRQSSIGLAGTSYRLDWVYDDFRALGRKTFPTAMKVSFWGGKKPVEVALGLSRLSTDTDWAPHTTVSNKYEKVELEDILKLMIKK